MARLIALLKNANQVRRENVAMDNIAQKVVASAGVLATIALGSAPGVGAHSLPNLQAGCAQNTTPRFNGPNITFGSNVGGDPTTAAFDAADAWTWFTDINFTKGAVGSITAGVLTNPDPDVAGVTTPVTSGCMFVSASVFYNSTHVQGRATIAEKRCIYAHEIGHAIGLAHSNVAAENDTGGAAHTAAESIMRGHEHASRCHNGAPFVPGSADIADVNAKY